MINPLTLISTVREKILFCVALVLIGITMGWWIHGVIDAWLSSVDIHRQLEQAKEAPAKLSKFNQDFRKTNVDKEPCANQSIPDDALKLLR